MTDAPGRSHGRRVRPGKVGLRAIVPLLATAAGASAPLQAQRVTGRVIDAGTGERIATVQIALVDQEGTPVRVAFSDSAGYFVLEARRPGMYRLRAERIGYAGYTSDTLELAGAETINVVIRLAARGIPLQPLEVRARGGDERGRYGFERRRALGRGVFLTVDSIRLREPVLVSDAFHGIPGVQVFEGIGAISVFSMHGGKCFVMFIDHMPVGRLVGTMPDLRKPLPTAVEDPPINRLKVDWIQGIEIYRDFSEVPRELRTASRVLDLVGKPGPVGRSSGGRMRTEPCGMIWIWTNLGW